MDQVIEECKRITPGWDKTARAKLYNVMDKYTKKVQNKIPWKFEIENDSCAPTR